MAILDLSICRLRICYLIAKVSRALFPKRSPFGKPPPARKVLSFHHAQPPLSGSFLEGLTHKKVLPLSFVSPYNGSRRVTDEKMVPFAAIVLRASRTRSTVQ